VQIERLRKEGSRLVAEEQEKLQQQLRDDDDAVSRLYCDTDSGLRLRVCLYPAHSLTHSLSLCVTSTGVRWFCLITKC